MCVLIVLWIYVCASMPNMCLVKYDICCFRVLLIVVFRIFYIDVVVEHLDHTHARTHARAHTHTHTQHECRVGRFGEMCAESGGSVGSICLKCRPTWGHLGQTLATCASLCKTGAHLGTAWTA